MEKNKNHINMVIDNLKIQFLLYNKNIYRKHYIVKYLRNNIEAIVNYRNQKNNTLLHFVAKKNPTLGLVDFIEPLIEMGINIDEENDKKNTALIIASRKRNFEIIKILLKMGSNPNVINKYGMSALLYISTKLENKNDYEIIKKLLIYGANPNYKNSNGTVALMFVSEKNTKLSKNAIKKLIKSGADPNTYNIGGFSPLSYALHSNNALSNIKTLLKFGANINQQNKINGWTLLMHACSRKENAKIDVIKYLLGNGADVNIKNWVGQTALTMACKYKCNFEAMSRLLDYGSDITIKDCFGKTPVYYMLFLSNHKIKILIDKIFTILHYRLCMKRVIVEIKKFTGNVYISN